jgi:uncharacterized protein DUF1843
MPTRKKATTTKKASAKSAGAKAATGPVPPYGEAIRGAVARGDAQEMKDVAANAKKWVADVQAALKQLDTAVKKTRKR